MEQLVQPIEEGSRRTFRTLRPIVAAILLLVAPLPSACAQNARSSEPPSNPQSGPEARGPSPELLDGIVRIETTVPAEARSAASLGTERDGSGVVIDGDGLILTIGYLVMEADSIVIETAKGKRFPASLVAYDHETGFGLIRSALPPGVPPVPLGTSAGVEQKQPVLVATSGGAADAMGAFVVDRRDFAGYWEYLLPDAIFTSPPHPRFGGAALLDAKGMLIGIGSLIVGDALRDGDRLYPGNMFIPVDALKPIMADLVASGRAARKARPWLGITSREIQGRLLVQNVPEDGPAWKAGVRAGDLVVGVAGEPVGSLADFYRKVWSLGEPGTDVPLLVVRGNAPMELTVHSIDRYRWLKLRPTY